MTDICTTGRWEATPGHEDAFVDAWTQFAEWASEMPGAGTLRLTRDVRDPGVFVSFGTWDSMDAVKSWKTDQDFRERMARVLQHVTEFEPAELAVVAIAEAGRAFLPI